MIEIPILYEDESLLVICKPAGVVINRAESVKEETAQDWMEEKIKNEKLKIKKLGQNYLSTEEQEFLNRTGIVHRLDKETSGVMVLSKTVQAFHFLKMQFKERKTEKKYRALVHGSVAPLNGTINLPLKRNVLNRRRFAVNVEGKMARTEYQVETRFKDQKGNEYSLLDIGLKTGRTHQIRVHFSHLGYPLVSDPIYLGKRLSEDTTWCPRLFLHSYFLAFTHPETEKRVEYSATLPKDLTQALDYLSEV